MRGSWKDGLVNAFPIPEDRKEMEADADSMDDESLMSGSQSFPFFDLPSEIRNTIYNLVLFTKPVRRDGDGRRNRNRISVLLASKKFHAEASYVLYTTHAFRVFKIQDFLFLPAIQELPPYYRSLVTNLELIVGSSWTNPPKSWRVSKLIAKCLSKMKLVRTLKIFVECDPSQPTFEKYRISRDFYTDFCGDLLRDTLKVMPQLEFVELDGNPGVDVNGPLVSRLRTEAMAQNKTICWSTQNNWAAKADILS